jgi:Protein of unknown function (DUF1559)
MNETEMETLLRQAPRPAVPLDLKAQLLEDIPAHLRTEKASRPAKLFSFGPRWMPALSFGLLLLGCLIALAVQTSQYLEWRQKNEALRTVASNLDQLRSENAQLQSAREKIAERDLARKEHEEWLALGAEVARLRKQTEQLPALQAEHKRLLEARAAAAAQARAAREADASAEASEKARRIQCVSNLKQIGLAARMWAQKHGDVWPEDFLVMSNELNTPKILVCPSDTARQPARQWSELTAGSISYQIVSKDVSVTDPDVVFARCPIHNNVGLVDGSVQMVAPEARFTTINGKTRWVH